MAAETESSFAPRNAKPVGGGSLLETVGTYDVLEVACDPHYWREQLARWEDLGLPVVEWPTNVVSRMVPACREFYTAVVEQRLTHDADPSLARHISNATVKEDQAGTRIVKRNRGQKIDLAVAAIIAYDRAHARRGPTTRYVGVDDLEFFYAQI